jgi:hypothetical protein
MSIVLNVRNMRLMIGRIKVHTIPARREGDLSSNSTRAEVVGQMGSIVTGAGCSAKRFKVRAFKAAVTNAAGFTGCVAEHWVTGEHAETLLSSSNIFRMG